MLLFSDVLLLTRRHGKILSSIESPISLDNLLVQDINCTEGEPTSSVGSADSSEYLELSITSLSKPSFFSFHILSVQLQNSRLPQQKV